MIARHQQRRTIVVIALSFAILAIPGLLWAQGRLVDEVVHSVALEGNLLGDSPDREIAVYLPPGYDDATDQRYPVLYLLHGYTANHRLWTGSGYLGSMNVPKIADALIEQGGLQPMIVVMPNGENAYWGSWYTNSSVTGNWEDFVTLELVEYIDRTYRTLPQADSRGIAGHSMGGYGAITLAIRHPDIYSAVYAMSAAAIAMEEYVLASMNEFLKVAKWDGFGGKNFTDWKAKAIIALSAAVAPNPEAVPFMADLPVEEVDGVGRIAEAIWPAWLEHDPVTMVSTHGANLLKYRAVRFDCGSSDFLKNLIGQNRLFSQQLTSAGIPHVFEEYEGDHTSAIVQRMETKVLPFFSEVLSHEAVSSVVTGDR